MAGSSMKSIKLRIKSVESTMQITRAMQLVATSKLRRSKERMEMSRPYVGVSREAIYAAVRACTDPNVPFVAARPLRKRCYIVIAGERGLAGGYNANVFKAVAADAGETPYMVLPIGRKAIEKFPRIGVELVNTEYAHVETLRISKCFTLVRQLLEAYHEERFDELVMVYTSFVSMMSQEVRVEKLLPVVPDDDAQAESRNVQTVYDPSPEETLVKAMPDYLAGRLYAAGCDAFASEVAARRNAMDSATKNAGEMIDDLRLKFNRARQGAITQEITEIVAGSEN